MINICGRILLQQLHGIILALVIRFYLLGVYEKNTSLVCLLLSVCFALFCKNRETSPNPTGRTDCLVSNIKVASYLRKNLYGSGAKVAFRAFFLCSVGYIDAG